MREPGAFDLSRIPVETEPARASIETPLELARAGTKKAELNRLLKRLYDDEGRVRDRRAFMQMRAHREVWAETEYVPVINALRALGRERLIELRRQWLTRLEKGYAMLNLNEDGHRLFNEVLTQYEAIEDALAGSVMTRVMDRLDLIEKGAR